MIEFSWLRLGSPVVSLHSGGDIRSTANNFLSYVSALLSPVYNSVLVDLKSVVKAVYQDLAVAARFSATVRATIIPVHRCGELEQQ